MTFTYCKPEGIRDVCMKTSRNIDRSSVIKFLDLNMPRKLIYDA
jgi:hypothetical protein